MRKLTDGYVKQILDADGLELPKSLIETKRAQLHLNRVIRFKQKEVNDNLKPEEKSKAAAVYKDANEYFDNI